MLRFLLVLPLILFTCLSSGCFFCKRTQDCQDPTGRGLTRIDLRMPTGYELQLKGTPPIRFFFAAKGKTLECMSATRRPCVGTMEDKHYYQISSNAHGVSIETGFFYKELYMLVQHNGVTLFDGVIDFTKKPHWISMDVGVDSCYTCDYRGDAYLTATVGD